MDPELTLKLQCFSIVGETMFLKKVKRVKLQAPVL